MCFVELNSWTSTEQLKVKMCFSYYFFLSFLFPLYNYSLILFLLIPFICSYSLLLFLFILNLFFSIYSSIRQYIIHITYRRARERLHCVKARKTRIKINDFLFRRLVDLHACVFVHFLSFHWYSHPCIFTHSKSSQFNSHASIFISFRSLHFHPHSSIFNAY